MTTAPTHPLLPTILKLHDAIRHRVVAACEAQSIDDLSRVAGEADCDTIYGIDRVSEEELVGFLQRELPPGETVVLIAEGLPGGRAILPKDGTEQDARWRIIVDPIDGTRCLMYQKRSAWILTGVAPNRGPDTGLADIELAVQTEIPLVKQHLCDQLWTVRGQAVVAEQVNRLTGERRRWTPSPSRATTILQGFATLARFFPGARDVLAAIDDQIALRCLGTAPGKALAFEDQYTSTGGQFYGLLCGQDRFIADLRPLMGRVLAGRGLALGMCCHPYDACTELIARQLGVIVTDADGQPLNDPLDVDTDVAWIGYANEHIRAQVAPVLQDLLREKGIQ